MKWNKFTIKTTTAAEDLICNMLAELGIDGVEIEDNIPLSEEDAKTLFVDIPLKMEPDNGKAYISFYLEEDTDHDSVLTQVKKGMDDLTEFIDLGEGTIARSQTEDKDWINNWKEFFKPFQIDDIIIKPTWEKVEDTQDRLVIEIDPGIAFGTGLHETTRLCIRQIKKYLTKDTSMLDAGCGSGILSIIGLKLGAQKAAGIDIDPNAVKATKENMEVNKIPSDKYEIFTGNIIEDDSFQDKLGLESYDMAVANILADVIIPLAKIMPLYLKKGALFITSGIINTKEAQVVKAMEENNLEIVEITRDGDWVSVTVRKN